MSIAKKLFPDYKLGDTVADYQPIIDLFGTVVVQRKDEDWQGDTWVLYRDNDRFGFLTFGWGSCSGCDALMWCESYADLDELIEELRERVLWFGSIKKCQQYFDTHDWEGEFYYGSIDFQKFFLAAKQYFETAEGDSYE